MARFGDDAVRVGRRAHAQRHDFWQALRPLGRVEPVVTALIQAVGGVGYEFCATVFSVFGHDSATRQLPSLLARRVLRGKARGEGEGFEAGGWRVARVSFLQGYPREYVNLYTCNHGTHSVY